MRPIFVFLSNGSTTFKFSSSARASFAPPLIMSQLECMVNVGVFGVNNVG